MLIVNPTDRERRFRIHMTFRADARGTFDVTLDGPLIQDNIAVTKTEPPDSRTTYEVS